MKDRKNKKTGR